MRVGKGLQGPSLEMAQSFESGGYVTRIYQFNGQILQEYVMADADFDPDNAIVLVRSERFDVTVDGNLVTVATDQGTSQTCLRSMPRVS